MLLVMQDLVEDPERAREGKWTSVLRVGGWLANTDPVERSIVTYRKTRSLILSYSNEDIYACSVT